MNAVEHSQNHYHRKYYVHIWSNWSVCLCVYLFLPILDHIRGNWWTWIGVHLVLRYIIPRQLIIRTFFLSLLSIQCFLPLKLLIRSAWHFLPIVRTQMQKKNSIRTQRCLVVFIFVMHGMRIRTSLKSCPWVQCTNLYMHSHRSQNDWSTNFKPSKNSSHIFVAVIVAIVSSFYL